MNGDLRAAKYPDQVWNAGGTCSCATTPEILPVSSTDCRLTDPDKDDQPGILANGSGFASDTSVAISASLKIVHGEVRADREHVIQEQLAFNMACVNAGCTPLGTPDLCSVISELHPLEDDATCGDVLALALPIPSLAVDECYAKGN